MSRENARSIIRSVEEVLWNDWDPIGVNEGKLKSDPDCDWSDEYDFYAPAVAKLLLEGADQHRLSKFLKDLARVNMGLSTSTRHNAKVAKILINL